jgi:hypothetical protein
LILKPIVVPAGVERILVEVFKGSTQFNRSSIYSRLSLRIMMYVAKRLN